MPDKIHLTCGKCGARFPVQGVVKQCPVCNGPIPERIVKLLEGDPSAMVDLEVSAIMDHMQTLVKAVPRDESPPRLVTTLKARQKMPEFVVAMLDVIKGEATPDQCKLYIRQMLSMFLQLMVDHGGDDPVVEFKRTITDWFKENLPGVEVPYVGETPVTVLLRDLPLGSYAIHKGRKVRLVSRVEDGEKADWVGLRYQDTRELKNLSPETEVVPYAGETE